MSTSSSSQPTDSTTTTTTSSTSTTSTTPTTTTADATAPSSSSSSSTSGSHKVAQSAPALSLAPDAGSVAGLDGLGLPAEEARRIQAQMANVGGKKQEGKFIINREGETATIAAADIVSRATLFFKNCTDCNYTINGECTKVLIEGCKNSTFSFNARIITEMLEIWNCHTTLVTIDTPIKTIQADTSAELSITYLRRELMDNIVWAGISGLHVTVGTGELAKKFDTSVEEMREQQPDLNEKTDQYIVRYLKGKLQQELVVRLANGFPTTDREADAFDEKKARNDKRYEDYIRKMIKAKEVEKGLDKSAGGPGDKKVPRNGPCPCGSGKKYKKCCGAALAESK